MFSMPSTSGVMVIAPLRYSAILSVGVVSEPHALQVLTKYTCCTILRSGARLDARQSFCLSVKLAAEDPVAATKGSESFVQVDTCR
ncbi:hypothetical protein D9M72_548700 [compost metagenome]